MSFTIIKVQPVQVPRIWELIKFAAVRSQEIAPDMFQPFCVRLLHSLLNGRTQCWVRYDETGTALSVQLTQISNNDIMGIRELLILGLYSFKALTEEEVKEQYSQWKMFAATVGCKRIVSYSSLPRSWQFSEMVGMTPGHRQYICTIGGD